MYEWGPLEGGRPVRPLDPPLMHKTLLRKKKHVRHKKVSCLGKIVYVRLHCFQIFETNFVDNIIQDYFFK